MKKILCTLALALALCLSATSASADTILLYGDGDFVGFYFPPEPASLASEAGYINNLITVAAGDTDIIGGRTYNREDSPLAGPFPTAVTAGAHKVETSVATGIDVTGFTYLIAKYDGPNGGGIVWLVNGLSGEVSVPTKWGPADRTYGLSHYSLFNPTSVPDGGATLMLLGAALVGVGAMRRKVGR